MTGTAAGAPAPLALSVVIPAYRCASQLDRCLHGLLASGVPRDAWEIIVVDDGSGDDTPSVATERVDHVVTLPDGPHGPAYARNVGALRAQGEVLLFIDADVVVHPATPGGFLALFRADRELTAAYGAYDAAPAAPGFVSQYRNLLHHLVHLRGAGPSTTFWAGCGAVRRQPFISAGGFDSQRYHRPAVEDIELGYRLTDHGHRIQLVPELQATHLKRWTLRSMLRTDLRARAIPWMHLLLDRREAASDGPLNVGRREKLLVLAAALGASIWLAALLMRRPAWLAAATLGLLLLPLFDLALLREFAVRRGKWFAARVVPMRTLFYLVSAMGAAWAVVTHRPSGVRRPALRVTEANHAAG